MRWTSGILAAALAPLYAGAEPLAMTLERVPVDGPLEHVGTTHSLFPGMKIEIPFATSGGILRIDYHEGQFRVDLNGDGQFDEGEHFAPASTINVPVIWDGKTFDYPIALSVLHEWDMGEGQKLVSIRAAATTCLSSTVAGGELRLYDENFSGTFGDFGDTYTHGTTGQTRWARMIALNGALYEPQLDGASLVLKPWVGDAARVNFTTGAGEDVVVTGTLRHLHQRQFARIEADVPATIVPGRYLIEDVQVRSPAGVLLGRHAKGAKAIALSAGEQQVRVGPPFTVVATAGYSDDLLMISDVQIRGTAGESYEFRPNRGTSDVFAIYIRSGDREQHLGDLEYG